MLGCQENAKRESRKRENLTRVEAGALWGTRVPGRPPHLRAPGRDWLGDAKSGHQGVKNHSNPVILLQERKRAPVMARREFPAGEFPRSLQEGEIKDLEE